MSLVTFSKCLIKCNKPKKLLKKNRSFNKLKNNKLMVFRRKFKIDKKKIKKK